MVGLGVFGDNLTNFGLERPVFSGKLLVLKADRYTSPPVRRVQIPVPIGTFEGDHCLSSFEFIGQMETYLEASADLYWLVV